MAKKINLISSELSERIEEFIIINNLKPNDKLPSEREFQDMWNVNRITFRAALQKLVDENKLYRIHGKGTYVSPNKIERDFWRLQPFSEAMNNGGYEIETKLISIDKIEANKKLAQTLSIFLGDKIVRVKRLRIVENVPLAVETSYLPYSLCQNIEQYNLEKNSLYSILKKFYGIELFKQSQRISIYFASEEENKFLEIKDGEGVLMLEGITYDVKGKSVEYSTAVTRGDRCIFKSILK